jgi:Tol biopolymer transport system component
MGGVIQRALATGALALLLTAAVAEAAVPAGPRLGVAKLTWHPRRVAILTVDPNGGKPARLARSDEFTPVDTLPSLSWRPDGAQAAFNGIVNFFLAGTDGSGARSVNVAAAEHPVFAPDGNTIAFRRYREPGEGIWTIDLTTGEQRQLTPSRRGLLYIPTSFSPDGSTLLATRVDSRLRGDAEPVALHLDTGGVTRLLPEGLEPVYSPDGSKIALFRDFGTRKVPNRKANDLFVLNLARGSLRRLTRTPHKDELYASWDPSGERIAFARFRRNRFEWANSIVQVNADGSCETEVLAQRRTVFYAPAWQPGPGREAGRIKC